jgi:hypothetical protein
MKRNTLALGGCGVGLGAVAAWFIPSFLSWFAAPDQAQAQQRRPAERPGPAREVTLTGRIVDLQSFVTGQYRTANRAECTAACIRDGVPAGLETRSGVVVLGQGMTGPSKTVLPHAYQEVDVTGKLYKKGGLRYLDITSIRAQSKEHPTEPEPEEGEEGEPEPEEPEPGTP